MAATKDRRRRKTNAPRPELAAGRASSGNAHKVERAPIQPLPDWNWKTFPVFFALAAGLFIGVFIGVPAGIANENGNNLITTVVFLSVAIIFGAALSRVTTRWILSRRWAKARARD